MFARDLQATSSPRPWGCFYESLCALRFRSVFPTPVGVFLLCVVVDGKTASLPHARGGVSVSSCARDISRMSSPRPWGCFQVDPRITFTRSVFPTPVGVFLRAS